MYKSQFLSKVAEKTLRGIAREGRKNGGIGIDVYRAGTRTSLTCSKCMADPLIFAADGLTGVVDVVIIYVDGSRKTTRVDLDAMGCRPVDSDALSEEWFEQNKGNIRRYMRGI